MSVLRQALAGRLTRVAAAVVVLTVAGVALVEGGGLRFCQPINHWPTVDVWAYQGQAEPMDVVFVGSSRTRLGVLPSAIEEGWREAAGRPLRAWCLGIDGGVVLSRESVVRDAVVAARAPKLLVVEIEPFELAGLASPEVPLAYFGGPEDWWYEVRTMHLAADWSGIMQGAFGRPTCLFQWGFVKAGYMADRFQLSAGHAGCFHAPLTAADPRDDPAAGMTAEAWAAWWAETPRVVAQEAKDSPCDPRPEQSYRRTILSAQVRGIPVAVITVPVSPGFYGQPLWERYRGYAARVRGIAAEYGVAYVDLNRAPFQQSEEDRWRDKGHMSRRGAIAFSRLVGRQVLPRLMNDQRPADGAF